VTIASMMSQGEAAQARRAAGIMAADKRCSLPWPLGQPRRAPQGRAQHLDDPLEEPEAVEQAEPKLPALPAQMPEIGFELNLRDLET